MGSLSPATPLKKQLLGCRGSQVPVPPLLSSSLPEAAPSPEVLGCCNRISPLLTALDSVFLGTALPKTLENRKATQSSLGFLPRLCSPFPFSKQFMNKIAIFSLRSVGLQCSNLDCKGSIQRSEVADVCNRHSGKNPSQIPAEGS